MGLRLFFLPNFSGAIFIQGATFIPDYRVEGVSKGIHTCLEQTFGFFSRGYVLIRDLKDLCFTT